MNDLLSQKFQIKTKNKVTTTYLKFLKTLPEVTRLFSKNKILHQSFIKDFKKQVQHESINDFSPLSYFWATRIIRLQYLLDIHSVLLEAQKKKELEAIYHLDKELIDFWEQTEFLQEFLNSSGDIPLISKSIKTIHFLENQIISIFALHIKKDGVSSKGLTHSLFPEVGDFNSRLYLNQGQSFVSVPKSLSAKFHLELKEYSTNKNIVIFSNNDSKKIILNPSPLGPDLFIIPSCKKAVTHLNEKTNDIEKALKIIQFISPELFYTFNNFTHALILIDAKGIVSYSMQSLPGYSSINVFDRDFVDLLDDLLHENGHHYLNSILNTQTLLKEDDEKIYYSPWRRSRRPVRGIYHAFFTFFWALKLFYTLNIKMESIQKTKLYKFNKSELEKIRMRFLEEFLMLQFCLPDLEHAYKDRKINKKGYELFLTIKNEIKSMAQLSRKIQKNINKTNQKKYKNLITRLKEERIKTIKFL